VEHHNTTPTWTFFGGDFNYSDDVPYFRYYCPQAAYCTASGIPNLGTSACDADGDAMTFDVEVVRRGQAFTRVPNYSQKSARNPPDNCAGFGIALTGLTQEDSYVFAMRLSDEWGAVAIPPNAPAGWVSPDGWVSDPAWGFDQGPCTTRQCACLPSGTGKGMEPPCVADVDCCSGVCVKGPPVTYCQ